MAATYVKINDWIEHLVEAVNTGSDQFAVALSNTAPAAEVTPPTGDGDGVLANVTQIAYTYLDGATPRNLTLATSAQTGGTQTVDFADLVLTAAGGAVGPFRYIYIYDDTVANDPLVCYFDYGSAITLHNGETLTITFNASGLFTIA